MAKTTEADFERFQIFAQKWIDKLGMKDWQIYFYHEKLGDMYAQTRWKLSGAVASISFCKDWDEGREFNDTELERIALHEVLHITMAQLIAEAEDRYANQTAIEIAEHAIIRRLENVLI